MLWSLSELYGQIAVDVARHDRALFDSEQVSQGLLADWLQGHDLAFVNTLDLQPL